MPSAMPLVTVNPACDSAREKRRVVAMPFAMVGAVAGAASHPWTKCTELNGRLEGAEVHLAGVER